MILSKHHKTTILIAGLLILALGIWFTAWQILSSQAAALEAMTMKIAMMEKDQGQIKTTEQDLSAMEPLMNQLDSLFISRPELVRFIEQLEIEASRSGIEFSALDIDIGQNQVSLNLQLTGRESELRLFFERLQQLPFLIVLSDLSLRLTEITETDSGWTGQATIILLSFDTK